VRILLALAALLVVGGLLSWQLLLPHDSAVPVNVQQGLTDLRRLLERQPDRARATVGLPQTGVYAYSIQGGESVEALLSTRHRYTGVATVTVTHHGCGVEERWRPLEERWGATVICKLGGEPHPVWLGERHEFFGEVSESTYACTTAALTVCSGSSGSISYETRNLGSERLWVDGQSFATKHLHSRFRLSGENSGDGHSDEWLRESDDLLLRKRFAVTAQSDAGGGADYREAYSLNLRSPTPER
jgi:hypothetical protein